MTEPNCKHGYPMPASQCPYCADIFRMEAKIEALTEERDGYRNGQAQIQSIADGLMDTIGKYAAERLIMRELLSRWLEFASDVQPSCAAGDDWLEGLRVETKRVLE